MGHHLHTKEFIVGATVGSLLGSIAALLVAPKEGRKLRKDLNDVYCDVADRSQDLAKRSRCFAKDVGDRTCDWASKAKSLVEGATDTIKGWVSEEEEDNNMRDLLIGGIVGGVLGAAVGLLLAPKAGGELRRDLADTYDDVSERAQDFAGDVTRRGKAFAKTARSRGNKWLNLASDVVEDLTEGVQGKGEELIDHVRGLVNNKRMNEVLDWARLGYRVWQGVQTKKRRR